MRIKMISSYVVELQNYISRFPMKHFYAYLYLKYFFLPSDLKFNYIKFVMMMMMQGMLDYSNIN